MNAPRHSRVEVAQHAGEFIQVPLGSLASPVVGLVTLSLPDLRICAEYEPTEFPLEVTPAGKTRATEGVHKLAHLFNLTPKGAIHISSPPIVLGEKRGWGTSTTDIAAAVLAYAKGNNLPVEGHLEFIQEVVRATDGAADPLLIVDKQVLYASRTGEVLKRYNAPPPRYAVLTVDTGLDVITNDLAAKQKSGFSAEHMAHGAVAEAMFHYGVETHDLHLVANAATLSAILNQEQVSLPAFDELLAAARDHALGLAISHSGSLCSFLLDPLTPDLALKLGLLTQAVHRLGFEHTYTFTTN